MLGRIAASVIGGAIGSRGAKDAGEAQADAARYAADKQFEQAQIFRDDMMPYIQGGYDGLKQFNALTGTPLSQQQIKNKRGRIDRIGDRLKKLNKRIGRLGGEGGDGMTWGELAATGGGGLLGAAAGFGALGAQMEGRSADDPMGGSEDPRLAGLIERRDELRDTRKDLRGEIRAGRNANALRADLYDYESDPLYSDFAAPDHMTSWDFKASPGYDWLLKEGQRALAAQQSAAGTTMSGRAAADFMQHGTGLASQDYNNWFARTMAANNMNSGLAQDSFTRKYGLHRDAVGDAATKVGWGINAASGAGNAGMTAAANAGTALMAAGRARSDGIMGGANAWTNALNDVSYGVGKWKEGLGSDAPGWTKWL